RHGLRQGRLTEPLVGLAHPPVAWPAPRLVGSSPGPPVAGLTVHLARLSPGSPSAWPAPGPSPARPLPCPALSPSAPAIVALSRRPALSRSFGSAWTSGQICSQKRPKVGPCVHSRPEGQGRAGRWGGARGWEGRGWVPEPLGSA